MNSFSRLAPWFTHMLLNRCSGSVQECVRAAIAQARQSSTLEQDERRNYGGYDRSSA